jgi:hypothetical protein
MVPKFQVATACFSCSPPDLNSSKFKLFFLDASKLRLQIVTQSQNQNFAVLVHNGSQNFIFNVDQKICSRTPRQVSIAQVLGNLSYSKLKYQAVGTVCPPNFSLSLGFRWLNNRLDMSPHRYLTIAGLAH